MRVDRVEGGIHPGWDEFVLMHPAATFCHLSAWSGIAQDVFGFPVCNLVARQGQAITGVLPLTLVKRPFVGRALISTPFCVYGGPVAEDEESSAALIREALALAGRLRVSYMELRGTRLAGAGWQTSQTFSTFEMPLGQGADDNLALIRGRQRAVVRKAIERELPVTVDRDLAAFYRIYRRSVQTLGTPVYPARWHAALARAFGDALDVTTVWHEEQPVCSVLSFYFRDAVMPYYGAGMPEARSLGGFPYLYFNLMNQSVRRGASRFDFGRSAAGSGAWQFKKNFGATEQSLPYSFHADDPHKIPALHPNNPRLAMLGRLWARLPAPVADLVGPPLSVYAI